MREGNLTKVAVGAGVEESDIQARTRHRWQTKQTTLDWIQLVSIWRLVSQHAVATTDWGGFPHDIHRQMDKKWVIRNDQHEMGSTPYWDKADCITGHVRVNEAFMNLWGNKKVEGLKVECIGGCLHTLCLWKAKSCRKEIGALPAPVVMAPFVSAKRRYYECGDEIQ